MKLRFICLYTLLACLVCSHVSSDDPTIPFDCFGPLETGHTANFLGPVADISLALPISNDMAISLLAEGGPKVYRFGGTVAFLADQHRFKISAEELGQDLRYQFSSGRVRRWVHQYAIGGAYQFIPCKGFCDDYIRSFDFDATYARASSSNLSTMMCVTPDNLEAGNYFRSIFGGRNAHLSGGLTVNPWIWANLSLIGDWDCTRFQKLNSNSEKYTGFGGTVRLSQRLPCRFNFDLVGSWRRPFNYYEAAFGWGGIINQSLVTVKFYGSYTQGKEKVPNVSVVGLMFDISLGGKPLFYNNIMPICSYNQNTCCRPRTCCGASCQSDSEILAWVANPAVYMPVVLTKASETLVITRITPPCVPPTSTPFPYTQQNPLILHPGSTFDASTNFSGPDLVYSLSPTNPNVTIDPNTGIISVSLSTLFLLIEFTVTATNSCNTTSQALWVQVIPF